MDRQSNCVLGPIGRSLDLPLLHIVERHGRSISILAHPEADILADILRTDKTLKGEGAASEIHGEAHREGREPIRAFRVPLDSRRPSPAMEDLVIYTNRFVPRPAPSHRKITGLLVHLKAQNLRKVRFQSWACLGVG